MSLRTIMAKIIDFLVDHACNYFISAELILDLIDLLLDCK